jgi:RNA polymerase sigma factor (sigma-70 family)
MDDQILWYLSLTDEEYEEYCADDELEDEWEGGEEPDPGLGVKVWDEDENEEDSDQANEEEEEERDISLLKPLPRRDVAPPRNLTSPTEIAALPFADVLLDLRPMLEHLVWRVLQRYGHDYRLERDDLLSEARVALHRATQRFQGRSTFGSFVSVVVENALTDHVRKQLRATEPVAEISDHGDDPTDAWIARLDLARALVQVPNGHLLLWHAAGFLDQELGAAEVTCVQRNRAKKKVRALLALDRVSSQAADGLA